MYYIIVKGSIQQEDIIFINIYAPSIGMPKFIKQILTVLEGEIGSSTGRQGILIAYLHQWIDHSDRKSIRKHQP